MLKLVILNPLTPSTAAPHHHSVLGSQGLTPLLGLWSCVVHFASGAPRCQPAAALPAGNRNCSERGKRRGQAYDSVTARVLRHCCIHPHDQGEWLQTLDGVRGLVCLSCSAYKLRFIFPASRPRSQQHAWFCELPKRRKRASPLYHEAHRG